MDETEQLASELAALHRGRGLRRPTLALGPGLRSALHIGEETSDVEARDRVVAALKREGEALPRDLRLCFLHAAALTTAEALLKDRLARAAEDLDRDARTVRRRLDAANKGVATALLRGSRRRVSTGDFGYVEECHAVTDLRGDRPVLHSRRMIIPTMGGVTELTEMFGMPLQGQVDETPLVRLTEGGDLTWMQVDGRSIFRYVVRLERPTEVGVPLHLGVEVVLPSRDWLRPYTVYVPYKPCRRLRVTVQFGDTESATRAWRLDHVFPAALDDDLPPEKGAAIVPGQVVDEEFSGLDIGYAYGISWR